jgi:hypothetical protein
LKFWNFGFGILGSIWNFGVKATLYTFQKDRKRIFATGANRALEVITQRLHPSQTLKTLDEIAALWKKWKIKKKGESVENVN